MQCVDSNLLNNWKGWGNIIFKKVNHQHMKPTSELPLWRLSSLWLLYSTTCDNTAAIPSPTGLSAKQHGDRSQKVAPCCFYYGFINWTGPVGFFTEIIQKAGDMRNKIWTFNSRQAKELSHHLIGLRSWAAHNCWCFINLGLDLPMTEVESAQLCF